MKRVILCWLLPLILLAQQQPPGAPPGGNGSMSPPPGGAPPGGMPPDGQGKAPDGRPDGEKPAVSSPDGKPAAAAGKAEAEDEGPAPVCYDWVLASVDGEPIILSEVETESKSEEARLFASLTGQALEDAVVAQRRRVVNLLIDRRLLRKEFKPEDYNIPDQTIESVMDDWGMSLNCKPRLELERWARDNHTTLADMRQKVVDYLIEQYVMFRQFTIAVNVTPRDTYEYFQAHRGELSQPETIRLYALFLTSGRSDLLVITEKIKNELSADPARFRDLAGTYSDGPFRARSGDLGWLERSQLRELFSTAIGDKPDPGKVIGPLTSPEGVYFLQVAEVKPAVEATYDNCEPQIRSKMELEQRKQVYENYMKTLRDKAVIRYY